MSANIRLWHIVVPVFNEEANLRRTIEVAERCKYADRITFVNDASTDRSGAILDASAAQVGFEVLHLEENRRKEGAIGAVLERAAASASLPPYTILLDADSFFVVPDGCSLEHCISEAIHRMEQHNLAGMAFRIEAAVPLRPSFIPGCVYTDYSGSQIDNRLTSLQDQLWVINGPGGIFRSDDLLWCIRRIMPDFETGDLLITVLLMAKRSRVSYWPHLTVKTIVPSTYREYFAQRRRWERGTFKVLWKEKRFYQRLLLPPRLLGISLLLHLAFPFGLLAMMASLPFAKEPAWFMGGTIVLSSLVWCAITIAKCVASRAFHADHRVLIAIGFAVPNMLLFLVATGPARVAGICDAILHIARRRHTLTQSSLRSAPSATERF